jgi:hypothetical protein
VRGFVAGIDTHACMHAWRAPAGCTGKMCSVWAHRPISSCPPPPLLPPPQPQTPAATPCLAPPAPTWTTAPPLAAPPAAAAGSPRHLRGRRTRRRSIASRNSSSSPTAMNPQGAQAGRPDWNHSASDGAAVAWQRGGRRFLSRPPSQPFYQSLLDSGGAGGGTTSPAVSLPMLLAGEVADAGRSLPL